MKKDTIRYIIVLPVLLLALSGSLSADLFHNHNFGEGHCCEHDLLSHSHSCPVFSILMNFSSDGIASVYCEIYEQLIFNIPQIPESFSEQLTDNPSHPRGPPPAA